VIDVEQMGLNGFRPHRQRYSVATGRFVAMLPGSVMRFSSTNWPVKILPVKLRVQPWPVAIMRLKNRTLSPVAQVFIDCERLSPG
jgi:DNA-binding transcriptional LysR family regulator